MEEEEEAGRRKRKMESDEDDEAKMSKFFDLINQTRQAHQRMVGSGSGSGDEKKSKDAKPVEAWNPSFRPEDFASATREGGDRSKDSQASLAAANPNGKGEEEAAAAKEVKEDKEESKEGERSGGGGDDLDLKLSL